MSLIKWNDRQTDFLPGFTNLMEDFFGKDLYNVARSSSIGTSLPAVNIRETDDDFRVEVAAPGMKKEDFKVRIDNNILSISSEKEHKQEEKDEKGNYTRREFSYQSFERSFTLPNTVDAEKISAQYNDGILNLCIPKREEAKVKPPRMINIQ